MTKFTGINQQLSKAIKMVFLLAAGLVLPAILIPIVKLTGYSAIVEEIFKAAVVLWLILKLPGRWIKIWAGIGFGLLFGISENFLYLNQIFQMGDMSIFWQRFLWTVPMHIVTVLIMVLSGWKSKKFLILGLLLAIILHLWFNGAIMSLIK